jgi:hypothetical protein
VKALVIAVYVLLAGTAATALAQDVVDIDLDASSGVLPPHTFSIYNASDQAIRFWLGTDPNTLSERTIAARAVQGFAVRVSSNYIIRILTGDKSSVEYALVAGKRYKIHWNGKIWDVKEIAPRGHPPQ